jgi:hypothetical protein
MTKKIVLINQATGYLFIDIANAFAEEYDEVVLMAGDILPMNQTLHPKIRVQKIARYNRASTIKRMFSWVNALLNIWWLLLVKYRGHDLFVSSNPPTASTMLPILFRRKVTLLIYDIYPDGLVAGNIVSKRNLIFRCWAWLNKKSYKKANKIIALTQGMAHALEQYVPKEKITVVPAWAGMVSQPGSIPESDNEFVKKYNLQGKFVVMYSGNLGKEYELETIVLLAEEFKNNPGIIFIISGKGWKQQLLGDMIAEKRLQNCMLLPFQPSELFVHSLAAFHIGIVSLVAAVAKVAIPSKTYNLLAAHRPVFCIGSEESGLANFLVQSDTGIAIEATQIGKMKTFIEKVYTDKAYFEKLCNNAATTAKHYTKERAKEIVALT